MKETLDSVPKAGNTNQWPFAVHLVFDRTPVKDGLSRIESQSEIFAARLHARLSSGDRSARVPVRLWRSQIENGERRLPAHIPLELSCKSVVVVLVDQFLFERRSEWDT